MRHQNIAVRGLVSILALSSWALAQTSNPPGGTQQSISFPQALETKAIGAKLFSLYDENSPSLRELGTGEILIARSEKSGWFEVEAPASFPCWIFAQYLDESGELGMGTVNRDGVYVRALASSEKNYPMGKVKKGEQFRVLDHKGEWTKVQSSSSVRAWVKSAAVATLGNPDQFFDRIRAAEATAESQWKERLAVLQQQREEEKKKAEARGAFQKADEAFSKEKGKAMNADFSHVRVLFAEAANKGDQTIKDQVKGRLETMDALEALIREKQGAVELENRAKDLEEKVRGAKEKALEDANTRVQFTHGDKLLGRFDGAGWVKRSLHLTKGFVYTLEKGGITLFEIEDPQGRYNLSDFIGREIGVKGKTTRDPGATVQRIEMNKLEVIAAP